MKTCLKAKSMVDVTVFISVRFYACMHACTYLWTLTADDSMKNVKKKYERMQN